MRHATRVYAVEPELSNALAASMAAGESVTIEPKSAADGLNGGDIAHSEQVARCHDRVPVRLSPCSAVMAGVGFPL